MQLFVLLLLLVYSLGLLFWVTSAFSAFFRTRVPFIPSRKSDIEAALRFGKVSAEDTVFDLGSGNGRVVFLVEEISGAKGVGIETGMWMHIVAKVRSWFKRSKAEFICGDIFSQDWSRATVIYSYLYSPLMVRVQEKFLRECPPGARLIAKDFGMPTYPHTDKHDMDDIHSLFLYTK